MKNSSKNSLMMWLVTLICGVACLLLRLVMMVSGLDSRGLLVAWHPTVILMWIVAPGYLIWLGLRCRRLPERSPRTLHPASGMMGACSVAAGLAVGGLSVLDGETVTRMLPGVLAGVCMVWTGVLRMSGKRTHYGIFLVICLYFIVNLLEHYRMWSADPQLRDYVFQILAGVMLMLASFHRTCTEAGISCRRQLAYTALAACFFAIASVSDPEQPVWYGACALWALTAAGTLDPA